MAIIRRKPGAYVERTKSAPSMKLDASTSIAGFVGETLRGELNTPVKITSWSQFIEKFAKGYSNPYDVGYIADSVEGFFLNGGSELYVVRVTGSDSVKAKATIPQSTGAVYTALEEGAWGNDISINVVANEDLFDLTVSLQGNIVETITGLSASDEAKVNAVSEYIRVEGTIAVGSGSLETGSNGSINASNYIKGLDAFDIVRELNTVAIPGVTLEGVQKAVADYCANSSKALFPIMDCQLNATEEEALAFGDTIGGFRGAIYYPWVTKKHSITGETKLVPPSGYVAGLYARTDSERGVHKAPAGVEANLKGIVGVQTMLDDATIGSLNSNNINCITPLTGYGIVVWGARLVGEDGDRKYVSDLRLDDYIETSIAQGTMWATFEPIDDQLFSDLEAQIVSFLENLRLNGSLKGESSEEAYYVICDDSINTDPNSSTVEIEIGYAKKKPAEFVVTRISQMREV